MWNRKLKQASKSSRGSSCTRKIEDNCADFISELPDHLLLHIFSFLDETAVFQSSVLSKRWHYLWTLVPFPMAINKRRSYFKKEKADIRKEKLLEEQAARNTISGLKIYAAKSVFIACTGLPFIMFGKEFVVILLLLILLLMLDLYDSYSIHHSSLCGNESRLKTIKLRDSIITNHLTGHLFPENYKPLRYAKFANLYGFIGMLLLMIISCSIVILNWIYNFNLETEASVADRIFVSLS